MNDSGPQFSDLLLTMILVVLILQFMTGCAPAAAAKRPVASVTGKEYLLLWAETEIMNSCETGKPVEFGDIDGQPYFFTCRPATGI